MIQVKVFYEHYAGMLEDKINAWLQDTKGIEIINVSSDSTGEAKIVYIFYKIKTNEEEIKDNQWYI